jgi:hypothetical protein
MCDRCLVGVLLMLVSGASCGCPAPSYVAVVVVMLYYCDVRYCECHKNCASAYLAVM